VRPLTNPIRRYAWGSRTALASLQRRPAPTPEPEAELWMGAHPTAPSLLSDEDGSIPLTEAIDGDPSAALGEAVVAEFGSRLPYLLKILAAAQPLSLQAHPDSEQARAGFAAEEAAGLARDAPVRNYADPYHKPELLVAIEEFDAGISSVAAPIADGSGEVIAAVHIHGPSYRFPKPGTQNEMAQLVVTGAARIAAGLREG